MSHTPDPSRYDRQPYRRSGRSGLLLPTLSLGLWHNFGDVDRYDNARTMLLGAFDRGITHFDLANNYGPQPGSAELTLGRVLRDDLQAHRDELIISTKAGYRMNPGPYGEWGSRKYMLASLDASLKRLGLPYVDIFYSHRPDPDTPLEETMGALDHAVRSGRALYVGLSNYSAAQTREASTILRRLGTPCVIHQPRYSMLDRHVEGGLLDVLAEEGIGCIAFSPLAQGLLTEKYLASIPADSRAALGGFLKPTDITPGRLAALRALKELADARGQTLAQLALTWVLRQPGMTSILVGASRLAQIDDALGIVAAAPLTDGELAAVDAALALEKAAG
ncbi:MULTISPECIES: aldo/keto reductase [unclassified Roseateles]|uniref:aldo/keto reductase n=1 Tax=unclassified Roseateles TaxID=2626991 RepID=UPI0006FBBD31|nr:MULTISPECIES: aldo/keto reductase [unclassified Roseateles]KQW52042.1 L-glyceraldehyde 3-phosphate reductase [Pelomonas sp. Root405]KRA78276.1 L-glyceraldehyde 3-phosphate reductase [Pelomonas sp. Root662]